MKLGFPSRLRYFLVISLAAVITVVLAACTSTRSPVQTPGTSTTSPPATTSSAAAGIHKIQHVIIIFQENRSFDSYFGVYPGADGIPMKNGVPAVSVLDPATHRYVKPYADHNDINSGGPHADKASAADVDRGKMDGFIGQAEGGRDRATDVMGYHTQSDIPNYWDYAQNFVLQDRLFESVRSWSFPSHLFMVSAWSAVATDPDDPMSAVSSLNPPNRSAGVPAPFAWTDITYLLDKAHVSWANYLDHGAARSASGNTPGAGAPGKVGGVPDIWNVLPGFTDVSQDGQLNNIQDLSGYYTAAQNGTLPAVSWIFPDPVDSEHPPAKVSVGQSYVTGLVNAAMQSPDWGSTAIFITWDDWGGFYDHVVPPFADSLGYGIRVPGLVVSPYAKKGYIDHQTLSFDAYLKFIEDDFLGGQRLDPKTDGRPDSRPDVRENEPLLGNLVNDFDFSQSPRPAMVLPVNPATTLVEN